MASTGFVGTGTTITAGTSTFTAQVETITHNSTRPAIDATHLSSAGARDYVPGDLQDGTVTLTIYRKDGEAVPITAAAETWTITYPDNDTQVFTGFITQATTNVVVDEMVKCDVVIQISDSDVFTPVT